MTKMEVSTRRISDVATEMITAQSPEIVRARLPFFDELFFILIWFSRISMHIRKAGILRAKIRLSKYQPQIRQTKNFKELFTMEMIAYCISKVKYLRQGSTLP